MVRFSTGRMALAFLVVAVAAHGAAALEVGFGAADITPAIKDGQPVYLAGLESNRVATDVHDKLFARAVVLADGKRKIALVSVDSIGLPRPAVQAARKRLEGFDYVLVASTHSHSAPDVVGIWGPAPDKSGVSPQYVRRVVNRIVQAVERAEAKAVPATAEYGTVEDESLLGDYRLPEVYDGVLRTVRFKRKSDGKPCGILVQWNSHGVEPRNSTLVTRDFMGSTVDALKKRHRCPVIYFQGAIGGLMGTPKKLVAAAEAGELPSDTFGFIDACGEAIADLADRALEDAQPIELEPLAVFAKPFALPLDNEGFRQALAAGVLKRPVFRYGGNRQRLGKKVDPASNEQRVALQTEVAYLRLGDLHVAAIPGELYPECVYGKYQDPVDPGADFPDAPLEPPIAEILPSDKMLVLGLANDEIGYIVPKRQWDVEAPYAYERDSAQYGERNSVGPETAGLLMAALADRVAEASLQPARQAKKQAAAARARRRQRNANPALTPIQDDPALPRVLLIGDSISIGYTLPVRAQLKGEANVHRIATNGGPTTNGLANLDQWLGNKKWDVIHFNWGLHDLKYIDDDKNLVSVDKGHQQVAIDAYEKNLRELVGRLKRSGATLVWCSTTPVPEGAQGRVAGDAKKYNAVAAKIMAEEDVAVDDLYSFAEPRLQEIQRPRNVHFTPAGSDALAEEVARNIREALKERASQ
mgnify:CR=1 FL=1